MTRLFQVLLASMCFCACAARADQRVPQPVHAAQPLNLDPTPLPLGGVMSDPTLWREYVSRFVTRDGRVVDTANGDISHSEGQAYGMLLAVAFGDRKTFDRIWSWTRANLMVRTDSLLAWRWDPNSRPAVSDINDAADGDLLAAWALTEAAEYWKDEAYRVAARRIAVDVGRKLLRLRPGKTPLLLSGVSGFDLADGSGEILNLSYYVFPALARLSIVAPEHDWSGVAQTGFDLLDATRGVAGRLPPDWMSRIGQALSPAPGLSSVFGYDAIRVPLYMAWAGVGERAQYGPFEAWARRGDGPHAIDPGDGRETTALREPGYRAVAELISCVVDRRRFTPGLFRGGIHENYYPATLRLFALIAANMRYKSCLPG